jgi:hypothetical protein
LPYNETSLPPATTVSQADYILEKLKRGSMTETGEYSVVTKNSHPSYKVPHGVANTNQNTTF